MGYSTLEERSPGYEGRLVEGGAQTLHLRSVASGSARSVTVPQSERWSQEVDQPAPSRPSCPQSLCAVTCDPEKMRALQGFSQAGVVNAQALSFLGLGNLEKGKGDLTQSPTVIVEERGRRLGEAEWRAQAAFPGMDSGLVQASVGDNRLASQAVHECLVTSGGHVEEGKRRCCFRGVCCCGGHGADGGQAAQGGGRLGGEAHWPR